MAYPKQQCRPIVFILFMVLNSVVARRLPKGPASNNNELSRIRGATRPEEIRTRKLEGGKSMKMCKEGTDISCSPTLAPSNQPSASPTISPAPSSSPSASPTKSPTVSPSQAPSSSPSASPTKPPSESPSQNPTATPTISPMPSSSPSEAPTETKTTDGIDEDGFPWTSCIRSPPTTALSNVKTSQLDLVYHMTIADVPLEDAEAMASSLEPRLHTALAEKAMTCDWDENFALIQLSAADKDEVNGRCPDVVADAGRSCWVVQGKITTNVYYHNRRRLETSELLGVFTTWLNLVMPGLVDDVDVFALELQGFSEKELSFTPLGDGSLTDNSGTTQLNMSNFPQDEAVTSVWALTLLGVAGAILAVLVINMMVRRRSRRTAYLRHLTEVVDLDLEPEIKAEIEARATMVDDTDENSLDEAFRTFELEDSNHDYRTCASPNCELCKNRAQPVFISSDMDSVVASVVQDLGPKKYEPSSRPHFSDTQAL